MLSKSRALVSLFWGTLNEPHQRFASFQSGVPWAMVFSLRNHSNPEAKNMSSGFQLKLWFLALTVLVILGGLEDPRWAESNIHRLWYLWKVPGTENLQIMRAALYVYGLLNISFPYCPTPSIFPHKILSPVFVTWVMLVKQHTYYYHCPLSWTLISWCGSFEDWIGTQVLKIMPTNSLSVNNPTAKSEPERVIMGFQRCNIHPTQAPGKIVCSIH